MWRAFGRLFVSAPGNASRRVSSLQISQLILRAVPNLLNSSETVTHIVFAMVLNAERKACNRGLRLFLFLYSSSSSDCGHQQVLRNMAARRFNRKKGDAGLAWRLAGDVRRIQARRTECCWKKEGVTRVNGGYLSIHGSSPRARSINLC